MDSVHFVCFGQQATSADQLLHHFETHNTPLEATSTHGGTAGESARLAAAAATVVDVSPMLVKRVGVTSSPGKRRDTNGGSASNSRRKKKKVHRSRMFEELELDTGDGDGGDHSTTESNTDTDACSTDDEVVEFDAAAMGWGQQHQVEPAPLLDEQAEKEMLLVRARLTRKS
jgi:hypothetical protein